MPIAALIQIVAVVIVAGVLVWGHDDHHLGDLFERGVNRELLVVVVVWVVLVLVC